MPATVIFQDASNYILRIASRHNLPSCKPLHIYQNMLAKYGIDANNHISEMLANFIFEILVAINSQHSSNYNFGNASEYSFQKMLVTTNNPKAGNYNFPDCQQLQFPKMLATINYIFSRCIMIVQTDSYSILRNATYQLYISEMLAVIISELLSIILF